MADDFKALIAKVATGATLSREEAAGAFDRMMSGEATPSQMGGLLMTLRVRGETVEEITGAVTTMRAKMLGVKAPADAVDVVGTGGDASDSTFRPAPLSLSRAPVCRWQNTGTAPSPPDRGRPTCCRRSA
jgi:anthranilate phosphoribosyltransferase